MFVLSLIKLLFHSFCLSFYYQSQIQLKRISPISVEWNCTSFKKPVHNKSNTGSLIKNIKRVFISMSLSCKNFMIALSVIFIQKSCIRNISNVSATCDFFLLQKWQLNVQNILALCVFGYIVHMWPCCKDLYKLTPSVASV